MSYVSSINEFLEATRSLSAADLNQRIASLDASATPVATASVAHAVLGYMQSAVIKGETPSFSAALARAEGLKQKQEWLFTDTETPTHPAVEVIAPVRATKTATATTPRVKKSDAAREIFATLEDRSKTNVIKVFMEKLGTTAAGAQTYFYACGGEKVGRRGRPAAGENRVIVRIPRREGPTKAEQAQTIFATATDKSRDAIINTFVTQLGMSKAGATTYFYKVGGQRVRGQK